MSKLITLNGTVFSRHVNTDITEEEFFEAFEKFLNDNDYLYGGTITEEDDDNY